jgi:putative cell wall-binding protein
VSFGPTCGRTYTAYTQLSTFADWIAPVIRDLPSGIERVAGSDRYATAAALARDRVSAPAPVVYLVTGAAFADALAVAPLAARDGGAVLLTARDELPTVTADALRDLDPDRVEIVGGPGAVSDAVAAEVEAVTGAPATRAAGADRYATATELSRELVPSTLPAAFPSVFLASGVAFADALGGAAAAADRAVPLLLTGALELPDVTAAELRRLAPESVLLLGGAAVVSDAVADAIRALGIDVERVAGADRYVTSARIATRVFDAGAEAVVAATGLTFPDALVAGALAEPILLLPAPDTVPTDVRTAISTLGASTITVLGGRGAVSDAQARLLAEARS